MRAPAALSIYVYLAASCFAASSLTPYEKSWEQARTPLEKGMSAQNLGFASHDAGRDADSIRWFETALAIWKATPGEQGRIARAAEALASVYRITGDYARCEVVLRQAIAEPSGDAESRALVRQTLADVLREEGKQAEARQLFSDALAVPGISWRRQVDSTIGLADLGRYQHQWQQSIADWYRAIALAKENRSVPIEAIAVRGLGQTLQEQGKNAEAEPLLRRALALFEGQPRLDNHQLGSTLASLGQLYLAEDRVAMAEEALRRSIDLTGKALGAEHPQVALLLEMLGDALGRRKQLEESRACLEHAWRIMAANFGDEAPAVGAVLSTWAGIEKSTDHPRESAALYAKAVAIFRPAGHDFEKIAAGVIERYAEVLKELHRGGEARALLAEAKNFRAR